MKTILFILLVIVFLVSCFMRFAEKYKNPYQVEYYVGVRGSGKTTLATKEAIQVQKKGFPVYSNFELFGAYRLNNEDFGFYHIQPNSYVYLDEISLIFGNRDFKSFPKEVEAFIRYVRKYKIHLRMYSQNYDADLKIRSNCDACYILVKLFDVFTIAKKVKRTVTLHSSTYDDSGKRIGEGEISENFQYELPGTWKFCFIPRWTSFFNSFEAPQLPYKEYRKYKFNDEKKLFQNTHFFGYLRNLIVDSINDNRKRKHAERVSFSVSDEQLELIGML